MNSVYFLVLFLNSAQLFFFFPLLPKFSSGLVHKTHMSSCRIDKPSEIVDVGDKVWVKLIGKEVTLILVPFVLCRYKYILMQYAVRTVNIEILCAGTDCFVRSVMCDTFICDFGH